MVRLFVLTSGLLLTGCYGLTELGVDEGSASATRMGGQGGSGGDGAPSAGGDTGTPGTGSGPSAGPAAPGGGSSEGTGTGTAEDLPCEVRRVLAQQCQSCHGSPLAGGAPIPLVTLADLTRPSYVNATQRVGDRVVIRMKQATGFMPPAAPSPAADIAELEGWVGAGMPATGCGETEVPQLPPAMPVCTTGKLWTSGNDGSEDMNPGLACISCHSKTGDGPSFLVAGTVYETLHELDRCYGADAERVYVGSSVEITDAQGAVFNLRITRYGNFFLRRSSAPNFQFPFTARVLHNGKESKMHGPQTVGDCNTCHTEQGINGAPGRILMPK